MARPAAAPRKQPRETAEQAARPRRSNCPLASALDILGDRWTLLLIRDLFAGKKRFGELLASPEHVPTNILADRLKRLQAAGLITPLAYTERPPRFEYHLTRSGQALHPVIDALAEWGLDHVPGTRRAAPQPSTDPS